VNIRHEILDWFNPHVEQYLYVQYRCIMLLKLVLLSFFRGLSVFSSDVLDVDLSSLFIIGNRLIEFS
jgi:hypothetical protein